MQRAFFASLIALAMPGLTHAGSLDLASVLTPQLQIVAPLRVDLPIATNNPAIGTITATPITPVTGSTTATPIYTVVEGPSLSGSGSVPVPSAQALSVRALSARVPSARVPSAPAA